MYRTLAMKELRETWFVWGFVLAATAYVVVSILIGASPQAIERIPLLGWLSQETGLSSFNRSFIFLDSRLITAFVVMSVFLTLGLGLLQTLGESLRGTYPFLLHRPMSRRRIIAVKLAVGTGLYFLISGGAILILVVWAATPGTHASPFEWSMTSGAWKVWMAMPILYFGAFLTGLRSARWFGTRLFPLIAAIALCMFVRALPFWYAINVVVAIFTIVCFIACIFITSQERDYS